MSILSASARLASARLLAGSLVLAVCCSSLLAEEHHPDSKSDSDKKTTSSSSSSSSSKPKYPSYSDALKDFKAIDGLIKLHQKENHVYAEISSSQFNHDFIVLISIARGIGEGALLGGMTWGFGDDWLWQFRKVEDTVHVVRRNVRFRANKGSPEEKAVHMAYTDSVLFALPIVTQAPGGAVVVDLDPIFMSDLPQISQVLHGFSFSSTKSTWASVKGFKDNVELEVAATYASSGTQTIDTVPDSRGVSINVHYSISQLPENGYTPRHADDRVGYFVTAVKDYSKKGDSDRFVRFVNRWDLQKADSSAELSPPKKPIIFWIEKTVPYAYRGAIRDGILEWNKAFEKAGFSNAIEVRQQPDNADWDPEDVNYNTFRWITSSAGFAMGPSRVNPTNGQILDADIIFDADFVTYWKNEYEQFTPASIAAMTGGPLDLEHYMHEQEHLPTAMRHSALCRCQLHNGMARQLAFGHLALAAAAAETNSKEEQRLLLQGLKEVTMHEVGHTLGLRHNFKGSTMLTLKEINDPAQTAKTGMASSVMDYSPPNIVAKGQKQGDFYSTTIGPWDMWAIEYGYKPFSSSAEEEGLKKIASRSAEPDLLYATDEDTRGIDSDPFANRFDLGKDPLEYAQARTQLISSLIPGVVNKVTKEGEGYQRARQAFGVLLGNYGQAVHFAARFVGGVEVFRDHRGEPKANVPFVIVSADKQRAALKLVEQKIFNDKPLEFPPELYNHLAATRWYHWGVTLPMRTDFAVHEVIGMWQDRVLEQLLSPLTLDRLYDSEAKVPAKDDAFTTVELFNGLTSSIFAELSDLKPGNYTDRKPAISSLRRNLQRMYVKRLSSIALGERGVPEDCQSLAYAELVELNHRLDGTLKRENPKIDAYSKAHLIETRDRIHKVIDARLTFTRP